MELAELCGALGGHARTLEQLEAARAGEELAFGSALLLVDGDEGWCSRLARAARVHVPRGPVVALSSLTLSPTTRLALMSMEVDACERERARELPTCLPALLAEDAESGVRKLLAFCAAHALSRAETRAVLAAIAGLSKLEACERFGCSLRTLESHWGSVFGKVRIRTTDGVVAAMLRHMLGAALPPSPSARRPLARPSARGALALPIPVEPRAAAIQCELSAP